MERVLASKEVKARLSGIAIGLAADCDAPQGPLHELFEAKLPEATMLPFVAFLTPDGQWIDGFSGYQEADQFLKVLTLAEASPLLNAKPSVRQQLEKLAASANLAADKSDWKPVLAAAREANKSSGRCPERTAIQAAEQKARAWAAAQFAAIEQDAVGGADLAPSRKRLAAVKLQFVGEPEAADAENGSKAILRLTQIRDVETLPNPAKNIREKAAETWKGTRWAAIFAKPAAAPGKGGK